MKPKILLTNLPRHKECLDWTTPKDVSYSYKKNKVKYVPLGILSLATNVSNCNITILDAESKCLTLDETVEQIENEQADIVGISAITFRAYGLKYVLSNISVPYVVVGGPHATHYHNQILEWGADAVFVGSLADNEFAEAILFKPKGVIFCKTPINNIKFPDRNLISISDYIYEGKIMFEAKNRMSMFSSIGCSCSCLFCDVQLKHQQRKLASIVVDEMEHLMSLGADSLHVLDDNFNISPKHVNSILDEIEKRNLKIPEWSSRGQAVLTSQLAERLVGTNFKRIHVGIEAVEDYILEYFHKAVRMKQINKFCQLCNHYNIDVLGYFILGSPVEKDNYMSKLPSIIKNLDIKHVWYNVLYPSPNTEYYQQLLKNGTYEIDHWNIFMRDPIPDYQIPYPYEDSKLNEILSFVKENT